MDRKKITLVTVMATVLLTLSSIAGAEEPCGTEDGYCDLDCPAGTDQDCYLPAPPLELGDFECVDDDGECDSRCVGNDTDCVETDEFEFGEGGVGLDEPLSFVSPEEEPTIKYIETSEAAETSNQKGLDDTAQGDNTIYIIIGIVVVLVVVFLFYKRK